MSKKISEKRPSDNEVFINNDGNQKVFGPNTVIQINLKTLLIVLGILFSGLTTVWININSKIDKSNQYMENEVKSISGKIEAIREQDLKQLNINVSYMRGKIDAQLEKDQKEFRESNNSQINQIVPVDNLQPKLPH